MQRLSGSTDVALYEACRIQSRVLVTLGRDFGEVLRFPPEDGAGIAILDCRGRPSPSTILARINELASVLAIQPISAQLWIVEPGRVRVHEKRERG
jgi:hypothetical protein